MKTLFAIAALASSLVLLSGCIIHVGDGVSSAKYNFDRSLSLDAAHLSHFDVDTKQGDITIIGEDGRTTIDVIAKISTDDTDNFTLNLKESGDTAYLDSHFNSARKSWISVGQHIDLVVYMPSAMALKVEQRSGDLSIKNIKKGLKLEDTSGDIELQNIIGNVDLEDTSGDINLRNALGNLVIDDTSGDIAVFDTTGNIRVDDNSGDIDIYATSGSVEIDDGSGDIYVESAQSLKVIDDGSGDVDYKNIKENISLKK